MPGTVHVARDIIAIRCGLLSSGCRNSGGHGQINWRLLISIVSVNAGMG